MITIKRAEILFYVALFFIGGVAVGLAGATNSHVSGNQPDWTVAPCQLWADTSTPKLPKYTITNICVADDGSLSAAWDPTKLHDAGVTK